MDDAMGRPDREAAWRAAGEGFELCAAGPQMRALIRDGRNVLAGWGIEVGTRGTFYSQEAPSRGALLFRRVDVSTTETAHVVSTEFGLPSVRARVRDATEVRPGAFRREVTFRFLEDSLVGDMVVRTVLRAAEVASVGIEGRKLGFAGCNVYHQAPVGSVGIGWADGGRWTVGCEWAGRLDGLLPVMYWRDSTAEPGADAAWVLHARLIAQAPQVWWVQGCSRWWPRLVPPPLSWLCMLPGPRHFLHNVRERSMPRFPIQVMGGVWMPAGSSVTAALDWQAEQPPSGGTGAPSEHD